MKIISIMLSLIICLSCFVFPVSAEESEETTPVISSENIISYNSDGTLTVEDDDGVQYVVFMVTNILYSNLEPYVSEMVTLHGEIDPNSDRMYAFGVVGPMCITQSIEEMNAEVNSVFALAEKYNVPVFFQMDDCTNYSQEFGNGATTADGGKFYNDPEMCEWVAFPSEGEEWGGQRYGMLPRWHCNWSGVPFATPGGFPCYNSEKYLNWYEKQVTEGFIKPLMENYNRLKAEGKGYLLAGINTGWETQIPDYTNDTYASLQDFEKAQYGMHALYNMGYNEDSLKKEADERLMSVDELKRELLYGVLADYIEFTCKMFYDAGVEKSKIFSHIVSISSFLGKCTTVFPPSYVCINDYCTPGWTMSPKTCPYDLDLLEKQLAENGRNEYVNAEGYAHYDDVATCTAYFEESLCGNAKLITVFGYDQATGTYGYQKSPDFYFVKVTRSWLAREIGPDYYWSKRPSLVAQKDNCNENGCTGTYSNGFCTANSSHYEKAPLSDNEGYKILNAGHLYWFANHVNNGNTDAKAELGADIIVNTGVIDGSGAVQNGSFRSWTPIASGETSVIGTYKGEKFQGTFDGKGYTINGLYISTSDRYIGLFGYNSSGTIKNVGVINSYFAGGRYTGAIAGQNEGTITNCYSNSTSDCSRYTGGIAGNNTGTISNCYNVGKITGTSSSAFSPAYYVGGISGANDKNIANCFYINGCASAADKTQNGIGAGRNSTTADTANVTTAKEANQFYSGEVAYLLQAANTVQTWGQKGNVVNTLPCVSGRELYAVAKYTSDTGYSIASLGDVNDDTLVDENDYQVFVNVALSDENTVDDIPERIPFLRGDINGDWVVDVLDASLVYRMYFGQYKVPIHLSGDFDGDGVCTDSDTEKIKETITNKYYVGKGPLYSCDFNGDGYLDDWDLEYAYRVSANDNYVYFNTKYGSHERHTFDLYIPKDKKVVGIVLMLHGGAWIGGSKEGYRPRLEEFASKGYAAAAVNYRYICDTVDLDDIMDDIEQAVALMKKIADSHGVEISGFLSTGGSAGGHLALHYAYSRAETSAIPPAAVVSDCGPTDLSDEYYYYNEDLQKNNGIGDPEYVAQVLGWAGGYKHSYATRAEAKEALRFVSPIYYVNENTVPTVINHGMLDDIVPYRNAVELDAKLTEYGIEHVLNSYPNSGHGLDADPENMAYNEALLQQYVVKFLDSVDK
ncbi:MAG: prolyl oligopeptidase family serine peptidase [Clostridia bacterium]|nr:prolyl oligopeptidase family serine peptidase [Clostridia bacterium]